LDTILAVVAIVAVVAGLVRVVLMGFATSGTGL
jgi:hypothetical protein